MSQISAKNSSISFLQIEPFVARSNHCPTKISGEAAPGLSIFVVPASSRCSSVIGEVRMSSAPTRRGSRRISHRSGTQVSASGDACVRSSTDHGGRA
jgi:hypothetical protein